MAKDTFIDKLASELAEGSDNAYDAALKAITEARKGKPTTAPGGIVAELGEVKSPVIDMAWLNGLSSSKEVSDTAFLDKAHEEYYAAQREAEPKGQEFRFGTMPAGIEQMLNDITGARPLGGEEGKLKDAWDDFLVGAKKAGHDAMQMFRDVMPNILFADRKVPEPIGGANLYPGRTPEMQAQQEAFIAAENIKKGKIRDSFKAAYDKAEVKHQAWIDAHPEYAPREEYQGGTIEALKKNPKLLLDYGYWAHLAAESAVYTLAFWGAFAAGTVATGNPIVGLAAGVGVTAPGQIEDLNRELVAAGADPRQAAMIALPVGSLIASIEVVGAIPIIGRVAQPFVNILKGQIAKELAKGTFTQLLRRGLTTFTQIEVAEVLEEIAQGVIQDTTVRVFDENRQILENIPETAIRTAMATVPLAGAGSAIQFVGEGGVQATAEMAKEVHAGEGGAIGEEPELPQQVPGEPEAGLQKGMFGEDKEVRPEGKGKETQVTMEDQLKLQKAREVEKVTVTPEQIWSASRVKREELLKALKTYLNRLTES